MKELNDILKLATAARREGRRAALATVVKVDGSSYRRPGARMLIVEDGTTAGSVSGGCLEADVIREGRACIETQTARLLCYDTTDDDIVFGIGLGCNGVIRIVVEPFGAALAEMLTVVAQSREDAVLAVRIEDASMGTDFALTAQGIVPEKHFVDEDLTERAAEARASRRQAWVNVDGAEVFFDFRPPPVPLILFGGGQDAEPLAGLAKSLGWHVTVVDHRPAYADPRRFPAADAVIHAGPERWAETLELTDRTVAVVMSHNYAVDLDNFARLLDSPVRYIGVLGPKTRGERMLAELRGSGRVWPAYQLRRVHSPVGLDIGADTPDLIALSILSEIQSELAGRCGGMLRDRTAPIYDPPIAPGEDSGVGIPTNHQYPG